ncbi:MAG: GGDEF domain-containing protein [Acidobacteriota bacterium]
MSTPLRRRMRYIIWPPSEPELADAGRAGEVAIAKARLVAVALLLMTSLVSFIRHPSEMGGPLGMAMSLVILVAGAGILRLARRGAAGRALGLTATLFDVSLVSLYHLLIFLGGDADMALHSRVTFSLYILAITATALRYDGRLVRIAGLAGIVQYLAITEWANATGRAIDAQGRFYGDATLGGQFEEVIILITATLLGSVIVERARVLRLSGIRDPLTKLANRSYFYDRFEQEIRRATRNRRPASVAMIDIDHFKRVNDDHGHAAGDMVLQRVSSVLRKSVRGSDLVARLGGEEFSLLMPDTPLDAARSKMESLRVMLKAERIEITDGASIQVTISAGVSAWPDDGADATVLLEVADARLLAGKRAGRDQVVAGDCGGS